VCVWGGGSVKSEMDMQARSSLCSVCFNRVPLMACGSNTRCALWHCNSTCKLQADTVERVPTAGATMRALCPTVGSAASWCKNPAQLAIMATMTWCWQVAQRDTRTLSFSLSINHFQTLTTWHAAAPAASKSCGLLPPWNFTPSLAQLKPSRELAMPTLNLPSAASKEW